MSAKKPERLKNALNLAELKIKQHSIENAYHLLKLRLIKIKLRIL